MKGMILALGVAVATLGFSGTASAAPYHGGHGHGYYHGGHGGYHHGYYGGYRGGYGYAPYRGYASPGYGYRSYGYPAYGYGYQPFGYPGYGYGSGFSLGVQGARGAFGINLFR